MSIAVDLLVREVVEQTLAELAVRDDLVDQVFVGLSATTRTAIKTFLNTARIDVRLGWTQSTTAMPCVAVTMPGEQESQQYVGSEPGPDYDTEEDQWIPSSWVDPELGAYSEAQVAQFSGAVDSAVYALNATEATWIAAMVKWIMLRNRREFEEVGLFEQRITMTDFMPANEYPQPDPAYTRVVKLQYSTLVHYTFDNADPAALLEGDQIIVLNTNE
jgi:hypothetical protein